MVEEDRVEGENPEVIGRSSAVACSCQEVEESMCTSEEKKRNENSNWLSNGGT
jgi:hypothetical protein